MDGVSTTNNPIIQYLQQEINVSKEKISLQKQDVADIILGL
jgi:cobalt-zinc-cadmium resistance protein CzcA